MACHEIWVEQQRNQKGFRSLVLAVAVGCDRHKNSTGNWKNSSDCLSFLRNHTQQQVSIAPSVQTLFASFFPWSIPRRRKQKQINAVSRGKQFAPRCLQSSFLPPQWPCLGYKIYLNAYLGSRLASWLCRGAAGGW